MNQFVAIRRRVSAVMAIVAMIATVALLSGLTPALSRAQADAKPADPAPTSEPAADTGKKAKKAPRPPKTPKAPRKPKAEKVARVVVPAAAKAEKVAKTPKAERAPRAAKTPKVAQASKAPEKSLEEQKKEDGVYSKGSNWLSFRFGYAKRTGDLSGDGLVGYGVGYTHMMSRKYAFGAGVGHDVVGHFGSQIDVAVPFTAEFERYFKWHSSVQPYLGLGGGFYLRKNYRTGTDYNTRTTTGPHLSLGFTSALDARHVIGFETRMARIRGRPGLVNPTFGPDEKTETIWTAKISWALVY